jgi:hypothetical protein
MRIIKTILLFALGAVVGFVFWYLIFWFVSNDSDPFKWHWITKIAYLLLSFAAASGIIQAILEELD